MCQCGNTGVAQTPTKSQHTQLTPEKKILPPLLPEFELAKFRSRVTMKLCRVHCTQEKKRCQVNSTCRMNALPVSTFADIASRSVMHEISSGHGMCGNASHQVKRGTSIRHVTYGADSCV